MIPGNPQLYVLALGLAAAAGYWTGVVREEAPGAENRQQTFVRKRMERSVETKGAPLNGTKLVRESLRGTIDERSQWWAVRRMSEAEVKEAIAELPAPKPPFFATSKVSKMLFYRWGELDPVAANAAAKAIYPKRFSRARQAVVTAWIKKGGASAPWEAAKDEAEMWDCTRSVGAEVAEMIVASLSNLSDSVAFEEVARLNDGNLMIADILCDARAGEAARTPESRMAFLTAAEGHPEPYVTHCAYEYMFREWAKLDIDAARAGAAAMKMSEENRSVVETAIDHVYRDQARELERVKAESP